MDPLAGPPARRERHRPFLQRWLAALESGDPARLRRLYHPDAEIEAPHVSIRGREELDEQVALLGRTLGAIRVAAARTIAEAHGRLVAEVTLVCRLGELHATHAFTLDGDQVARHRVEGLRRRRPAPPLP